jgi:hypothetical protein
MHPPVEVLIAEADNTVLHTKRAYIPQHAWVKQEQGAPQAGCTAWTPGRSPPLLLYHTNVQCNSYEMNVLSVCSMQGGLSCRTSPTPPAPSSLPYAAALQLNQWEGSQQHDQRCCDMPLLWCHLLLLSFQFYLFLLCTPCLSCPVCSQPISWRTERLLRHHRQACQDALRPVLWLDATLICV